MVGQSMMSKRFTPMCLFSYVYFLKVHKRENFFAFDFEYSTFS